jgi:hypothetical protein
MPQNTSRDRKPATSTSSITDDPQGKWSSQSCACMDAPPPSVSLACLQRRHCGDDDNLRRAYARSPSRDISPRRDDDVGSDPPAVDSTPLCCHARPAGSPPLRPPVLRNRTPESSTMLSRAGLAVTKNKITIFRLTLLKNDLFRSITALLPSSSARAQLVIGSLSRCIASCVRARVSLFADVFPP